MFQISLQSKSNLCLIGISNCLNFTRKYLVKLDNLNQLIFEPFTVDEIENIIKSKLNVEFNGFDYNGFIQEKAIKILARKMVQTGDLRKALDVTRYSIQLAQQDVENTPQGDGRVKVKHVLKAANSMLGSPIVNRIKDLSIHAKLILLSIFYMKQKHFKDYSTTKTEKCYNLLCNYKKTINPITKIEFMDVLTTLSSIGVLSVIKKNVIDLNVNFDDIYQAVKDLPILNEIIENDGKILIPLK